MTDSQDVFETLQKIVGAFFDRTDRKQLVSGILRAAMDLAEADRGSVFLAPDSNEPLPSGQRVKLKSLIATGLGGQEIEVDADQGVVGHVFTTGESVIVSDAQKDGRFLGAIDKETQYFTESILCVPLRTPRGTTLGVIEILNSKKGHFSESEHQILKLLALLAALALEAQTTARSLKEVSEKLLEERAVHQPETARFVLFSTHKRLQEAFNNLPHYAASDSSVLIQGESGTGKEVIAQVTHHESARRDKPFIAINCAAIPESLFEAELFGVAKGAATGTSARKGKIELADGGTLFLDEIGELPLSMQAKLLRVLQEKQVQRVGSEERPKQVDFRLIAATNRDLEAASKAGTFREDLFYRLNVIRIGIPPLRERPSDIPALCESILKRFETERGWKPKRLSPSALEQITRYEWPGNIRQLQNRLEGACIVSRDRRELLPEDLSFDTHGTVGEVSNVVSLVPQTSSSVPQRAPANPPSMNLKTAKDWLERELIERALVMTHGNKTEAAKILGITREGLRLAIRKLNPKVVLKKAA